MPQPWKAQRHKRGKWIYKPIAYNDVSDWRQRKSVARCKCTDDDKSKCTNFDSGSTYVGVNILCACRCHKGHVENV